eukprot:TRINITY_DN43519_c0_g1_i1.p1 TRINITY_DN43519_c0_g1~~TRINITY_DN43519_c0_g1_i1.p1  ORF type:complete len:272 (+),score=40.63 TRINITY_DN43519_c0_g1_i1:79-894(+)
MPSSLMADPPRCIERSIILLFREQAVTFAWREGLTARDFGDQFRAAVRHVTGLTALGGIQMIPDVQPPWPVTPRDIFELRLPPAAGGRLRLVVSAMSEQGKSPAPGQVVRSSQPVSAQPRQEPVAMPTRDQRGYLQPPQSSSAPGAGKFQKGGGSQMQFLKIMNDNKAPKLQLPEGTQLTVDEVAKHKTAGDCWTIYEGRVYDVSSYIDFHPGGKRQIMQGAGKDMTKLFMKAHHWVSMDGLVGKLCLGPLLAAQARSLSGCGSGSIGAAP